MGGRGFIVLVGLSVGILASLPATAELAPPVLELQGAPYTAGPPLTTSDGEPALDISGIACLPPSGTIRRCLAIDDDERAAQFLTIQGRHIAAGARQPLLGKSPSPATLGKAPGETCPNGIKGSGEKSFGKLDGEAVAYAAPYFYVAGSHGCTRKGHFRLAAYTLIRFAVSEAGEPVPGGLATTYRLSDALRALPPLVDKFGRDIGEEGNGVNLEGLAVIGDRVIAGLRSPSLDGEAFLVSVSADELFAPGSAPLASHPEIIPLKLGERVGIRDLTALPDGRLLVLAGSAQDQHDIPYALYLVEPRPGGSVKMLGTLPPIMARRWPAKAEGLVVLGPGRVLVLFDGLPGGGAREYQVEFD